MKEDVYVLSEFSPTSGTRKIGLWLTQQLSAHSGLNWEHRPFTLPVQRKEPLLFAEHMRLIFAVPVYAGRVPSLMRPYLDQMRGEGAKVFLLAVYGNRDFDDALREMEYLSTAAGMKVVGGAALIARHVLVPGIAQGRPDEEDYSALLAQIPRIHRAFEEGISASMPGKEELSYYQPKGVQGEAVNMISLKPTTAPGCIHCLQCVKSCPLGSIDPKDPSHTPGKCMKCCACVLACPLRLKSFDDPGFLSHRDALAKMLTTRKEPAFFY